MLPDTNLFQGQYDRDITDVSKEVLVFEAHSDVCIYSSTTTLVSTNAVSKFDAAHSGRLL